ncbi:hypothetical protein [Pantoea eucrina]|uniref:hypothetical protein n=1 Tax=Pantoea eucrina TaxID=472693 RepID=UPI001111B4CB|nr:hypothetical protein [Pantoea eucrina]
MTSSNPVQASARASLMTPLQGNAGGAFMRPGFMARTVLLAVNGIIGSGAGINTGVMNDVIESGAGINTGVMNDVIGSGAGINTGVMNDAPTE